MDYMHNITYIHHTVSSWFCSLFCVLMLNNSPPKKMRKTLCFHKHRNVFSLFFLCWLIGGEWGRTRPITNITQKDSHTKCPLSRDMVYLFSNWTNFFLCRGSFACHPLLPIFHRNKNHKNSGRHIHCLSYCCWNNIGIFHHLSTNGT